MLTKSARVRPLALMTLIKIEAGPAQVRLPCHQGGCLTLSFKPPSRTRGKWLCRPFQIALFSPHGDMIDVEMLQCVRLDLTMLGRHALLEIFQQLKTILFSQAPKAKLQ